MVLLEFILSQLGPLGGFEILSFSIASRVIAFQVKYLSLRASPCAGRVIAVWILRLEKVKCLLGGIPFVDAKKQEDYRGT